MDVILIKDMSPLIRVLENKRIQKIFHDISFDLRIIKSQFKCSTKNIFDTQIAALILGKKDIGLGPLLKEYFGVVKESKFQMADWTKRPINKDMLDYAAQDSVYLIKLRNTLLRELEKTGRLVWVMEECISFENRKFDTREGDFFGIKGITKISDENRAVLKRLFDVREKLAKKVDRPVHFIMNNKIMFELSSRKSMPFGAWKNMRGVHPVVRSEAKLFFDAHKKGLSEKLAIPGKERKRYSMAQRKELEFLSSIRDEVSSKLGIQRHLVMSKDQMQYIVISRNLDSLFKWQKELVKEKIAKLEIEE